MTTILIALAAFAAVFVIGFLLGDRRGVKQCNVILDENQRELFKALRDDRPFLDKETGENRPTVH